MAKLKKRVKQKWLEALRSGEYQQTTGMLHSRDGGDRYCCLGVLCDVAVRNGLDISIEPTHDGSYVKYDGVSSLLPTSVKEWAMLKGSDTRDDRNISGDFYIKNGDPSLYHNLSTMNDTGMTFEQVADVIEREL